MWHWIDQGEVPFSLPTDPEPKTVYYLRTMSDTAWAVVQAAMTRQRKAGASIGRDPDEPEQVEAQKSIEHRAIAGVIDRIENVLQAGDMVKGQDAIFARVELASFVDYQALLGAVLGQATLTPAEGKA